MEYLPKAYYKIPYIDINSFHFDKTINLINKKFALQYNIIPMESDGNFITFCCGNPTKELYELLKLKTEKVILFFKDCPEKIKNKIQTLYKEI